MRLTISEIAALCHTSVRTLHYYDQIGLVRPTETSEKGYRYYDGEALALLQQVLFYRELELSLKEIAEILQNPQYDRKQALMHHRDLLQLKRQRLDELLCLVEETIGGKIMEKVKTTAAMIEQAKKTYAEEARIRWGESEAYKESEERYTNYTTTDKAAIAEEMDEIFSAFAAAMDRTPECETVQKLVERWQNHITKNYYTCTREILSGLGEMYVNDERFTRNIDRFGDGTADFMAEAIKVYCGK